MTGEPIDATPILVAKRIEQIVRMIDAGTPLELRIALHDDGVLFVNEVGFDVSDTWDADMAKAAVAALVYHELDRLGRLDLHEEFSAQWYGRRDDGTI